MDANSYSAMNQAHKISILAGTVLTFALLSSCGRDSDTPAEPKTVNRVSLASLKLSTLQSCDAYKTYVINALVEQYRPRRWSQSTVESGSGGPQPAPAAPASAGGDSASSANSAPTHVTGTNNQEAGVDEPDIVKTDTNGTLYIARGNFLRIVAGHPPKELNELAALDAGGNVYDLFLDETLRRVVLFAAHYEPLMPMTPPRSGDAITSPAFYRRTQYVVSFVDVSDPAQPVLTERWTLDGVPLDSRRTDARMHVVLSDPLELPTGLANDAAFWNLYTDYYNAPDADAAGVAEQKIVDAIRTSLIPLDPAALLPVVTIEKGAEIITRPLVGCGDISAPTVLTRPSLLTVASFDTDGANLSASAITADGATVYASPANLYITQYSGGWFNNDESTPQTAIHQFSISGAAPKYVATGVVDGWVQSSFNLSEYNGDLRVATNSSTWSKGVSSRTNDLFILRDNGGGELTPRGSVRDFGKGESMFSARFMGERGFVVTFRNVDPLFAFDLTDPDHPKLAGELTIPGFSTYMHPLGDNHLLTIGRDGATWGTQLQIFDVTDLAAPKLVQKYSPVLPDGGYSYSNAEYDHHAFTFDETNHVLAIPLSYSSSSMYFNGITAFKIDAASGISEIVRVDHADLANKANCTASPAIVPCNYWYAANPSRSVIMTSDGGVTLYSVSDAGVKATNLAPPNELLGSVIFPFEPPPPIGIEPPIVIAE